MGLCQLQEMMVMSYCHVVSLAVCIYVLLVLQSLYSYGFIVPA